MAIAGMFKGLFFFRIFYFFSKSCGNWLNAGRRLFFSNMEKWQCSLFTSIISAVLISTFEWRLPQKKPCQILVGRLIMQSRGHIACGRTAGVAV
jgi:hypothetical protein